MLGRIDANRQLAGEYDAGLLWSGLLLLGLGLVMVYSSSIATAEMSRFTGGKTSYFLTRHTVFLIVAITVSLLIFQVPMLVWQRLSPWLFLAGAVMLAMVLIPGLGREVNGARRWVSLGVATVQPSEFMTMALVLAMAAVLSEKRDIESEPNNRDVRLTLLLALVPLMIDAHAPGKEILHPVAITIFGGLISATALDAFLTPILLLRFGRAAVERLGTAQAPQQRATRRESRATGKMSGWRCALGPSASGGGLLSCSGSVPCADGRALLGSD